jgi:cobalt-zinc-cadmium efflux system outer membrane protein
MQRIIAMLASAPLRAMPGTHIWSTLILTISVAGGTPVELSGQEMRPVSIEEALRSARENHPALHAARAEVEIAGGDARAAGTFSFNPVLGAGIGPARSTDSSFVNLDIGIAQTFELGGKRGARTSVASARVDAANSRLARTQLLLDAQVQEAFYRTLIFRRGTLATEEALQIAVELRAATEARLRLGAGTQLEVNLSVAAMARSTRDHLENERQFASALLALTVAAGWDPATPIDPLGAVPVLPLPPDLDLLLVNALTERNDLRAVRADRRAAEANVTLARAMAWPDASIGLSYARQEEVRAGNMNVGLSLPLWNRNAGGRDAAVANAVRWEARELQTRREVERGVRDAYQRLQRARSAEAAFGADAVERLSENLQLAQQSFEAGKISLIEFGVVRRELIDTQLTYLDTQAELIAAFYSLQTAVGRPLASDEEVR